MVSKTDGILVPNNTSWFDKNPDKYLERDDFKNFARVAKIELRDLFSDDLHKLKSAQDKVVQQSVIFNEIQKLHFGYGFPLFVYTSDFELFEKPLRHNEELDSITLEMPMCDSLRRRHVALSHAILPRVVDRLFEETGGPVIIKNLGSGVGLDSLHLLKHASGKVSSVLNYDTDPGAIALGTRITRYLESQKEIEKEVVEYIPKSLTQSFEPADLIVKVGVICGLQDAAAQNLLASDCALLKKGGKLVVTSSNMEMRQRDPIANFMIQHIGSREHPRKGWGLNFRTRETLRSTLERAGFSKVQIYDDSNYPGKEELSEEILYGCDTLPARALDRDTSGTPVSLPARDVLDKGIGYNWIAVATKGESHVD